MSPNSRSKPPFFPRLLAGGAVVLVLIGFAGWYYLFRTVPLVYDDPAEHFKYGSIGNEEKAGFPYWIWRVLPEVFPEKLPGGYASLGLLFERGKDTPIGFPLRTIGFPRVGLNCAACH